MKKKALTDGPIKLELACGQHKEEGWIGIDIVKTDSTDMVLDLFKFPWPFKDGSVSEARCIHFLEHIPSKLRFPFMDELYRVLEKGGKCSFVTPYYNSSRAFQDPTHEWPPICEASFLYFNAEWRKSNGISHYDVHCDFDFSYSYGLENSPPFNLAGRNHEFQMTAIKHYTNSVNDLYVTVVKR